MIYSARTFACGRRKEEVLSEDEPQPLDDLPLEIMNFVAEQVAVIALSAFRAYRLHCTTFEANTSLEYNVPTATLLTFRLAAELTEVNKLSLNTDVYFSDGEQNAASAFLLQILERHILGTIEAHTEILLKPGSTYVEFDSEETNMKFTFFFE